MFTIKSNHGTFTVKVKRIATGSNYNISAQVFFNGNKRPYYGTTFKQGSNPTDIRVWAEAEVLGYPKNLSI